MSEPEQTARLHVEAARAAIAAAIRVAGPTMQIGDLCSAIISTANAASASAPAQLRDDANNMTATSVTVALVELVGARRMHEIINNVMQYGAGSKFA